MSSSRNKISIRIKLLLPTIIVIILVSIIMVSVLNARAKEGMTAIGSNVAETIGKAINNGISHVQVSKIELEGELGTNCVSMRDQLDQKATEYGAENVFLLGSDGQKVYYITTQSSNEDDIHLLDDYSTPYSVLKPCFESAECVQENTIKYNSKGVAVVTAYVPILVGDEVVAVLGVDYNADEVLNEINGSVKIGIIIALICIGISVAIIFVLVNTVVMNLKKVDSKVYELASNEGDLTQSIDVKSGDETEEIAGNLNTLLRYIHDIMLNISGNADNLGGASADMVSKLQNAQGSVDDVSATMEEMSATIEEITATISQVNEAVVQMNELALQINKSAEESLENTENTRHKAETIRDNASKEEKTVEQKAADMESRLKDRIEKSSAVKQIETLTEQILAITEQTSLLSLNASIEAARAGESGRGFAVVAEEIGKLATESADAAGKIQEVSNLVTEAVEGLADESKEMLVFLNSITIKGYGDLAETGSSYSRDMDDIGNMMSDFVEKTKVLNAKAEVIKDSIQSLNIAIDESADGIVNVSQMAAELANDMNLIGDNAKNNEHIAADLGNEVKKFKL